jgi:hypothetical protein
MPALCRSLPILYHLGAEQTAFSYNLMDNVKPTIPKLVQACLNFRTNAKLVKRPWDFTFQILLCHLQFVKSH